MEGPLLEFKKIRKEGKKLSGKEAKNDIADQIFIEILLNNLDSKNYPRFMKTTNVSTFSTPELEKIFDSFKNPSFRVGFPLWQIFYISQPCFRNSKNIDTKNIGCFFQLKHLLHWRREHWLLFSALTSFLLVKTTNTSTFSTPELKKILVLTTEVNLVFGVFRFRKKLISRCRVPALTNRSRFTSTLDEFIFC